MFHLFDFEKRFYIQHEGGLYWKFRYKSKSVAELVKSNLESTFKDKPNSVPRRLQQQFVQRVDLTEPCPKELDKDGSLPGSRSMVDSPQS